jgi:hypothetical protein
MRVVHEHERETTTQRGGSYLSNGAELASSSATRPATRDELGDECGVGVESKLVSSAVMPGSIPRPSASSAVLVRLPL